MSTIELKNQIKERIESVKNQHLLEEILYLIEFEKDNDEIFVIPEDHKKDLEISITQKKAGQTISNEVIKQRLKDYLQ